MSGVGRVDKGDKVKEVDKRIRMHGNIYQIGWLLSLLDETKMKLKNIIERRTLLKEVKLVLRETCCICRFCWVCCCKVMDKMVFVVRFGRFDFVLKVGLYSHHLVANRQ